MNRLFALGLGLALMGLAGCGSEGTADIFNPESRGVLAYAYGANVNNQVESYRIRERDGSLAPIDGNAFSDGGQLFCVEAPRNGRFLHLGRPSALQTLRINIDTSQLTPVSTVPANFSALGQQLVCSQAGTFVANPSGNAIRQYGVNPDGSVEEILPAVFLPVGSSVFDGAFDRSASFAYFIQSNGDIQRCAVSATGQMTFQGTTTAFGGPFDFQDCLISDNDGFLYVLDDQNSQDRIFSFTINNDGTLTQRGVIALPLGEYQNLTANGPFMATADTANGNIVPMLLADNGDVSLVNGSTNLGGLGLSFVPFTPYLLGGPNGANPNRLGSSQVNSNGQVLISGDPNTLNTLARLFDLAVVGYPSI
jgi:hypothetical protein